jgi:hypothetical protein
MCTFLFRFSGCATASLLFTFLLLRTAERVNAHMLDQMVSSFLLRTAERVDAHMLDQMVRFFLPLRSFCNGWWRIPFRW